MGNGDRASGEPAAGHMSRREVESVRRTRPLTISGQGRQLGKGTNRVCNDLRKRSLSDDVGGTVVEHSAHSNKSGIIDLG
jgi:hypothetical protein